MSPIRTFLLALIATVLVPLPVSLADGDEAELAAMMSTLQTFLHKLDLSVQGGNAELISFYIHELEETVEHIEASVPTYDGYPIAALTRSMMPPPVEALENALQHDGDLDAAMRDLIGAWNACHAATDHGFVKVTRATANPFDQSFD